MLLAMVGLALAAVGCGSSDSSSETKSAASAPSAAAEAGREADGGDAKQEAQRAKPDSPGDRGDVGPEAEPPEAKPETKPPSRERAEPSESTAPPPSEPTPEAEKGSTLTRAAFIKEGDAICREAEQRQESGFKAYLKAHAGEPLDEEKLFTSVGLPPAREEVGKLRDLEPPEGDEEAVEAILDGLEEAIRAGEKDPSSVAAGAPGNPFPAVERLARSYGFKVCGGL